MKGIPVLMYHALEDQDHPAGAKDPGEQLYVLQVSQFREQMEYLHREGYRTFLLEELQALAEWPDKAVVLTFDDGHESNYTLAFPILREFGFKAHFFITTGWIGTRYFMSEEQIKGLHAAGMGIGSHGVTHAFISDLDDAGVQSELAESKNKLAGVTGLAVNSFSAPGGRENKRVAQAARQLGYSYVCTSQVGTVTPQILSSSIPRFPVRNTISFTEFVAIVTVNELLINKMVRRAKILDTTKMILGNRLYEQGRSFLIG